MMRWTAALLIFLPLCWISTPSRSADISGAWKIDTRGGPVPLCSLVQVGNDLLSGTCVGPQAAGPVTGTVVGPTVRWRWQWAAYAGGAASAFDFTGTLQPDNSIIGTAQVAGRSLDFKATKVEARADTIKQPGRQTQQPTSCIAQLGGDEETALVQRLQAEAREIYSGYKPGIYGNKWATSDSLADAQQKQEAFVEKGLENYRASQGKVGCGEYDVGQPRQH
jgi:hypothetical protein